MTSIMDTTDLLPVTVPLSALRSMTPQQADRLAVLMGGFRAAKATLIWDSWHPVPEKGETSNLLFSLFDSNGTPFYHGMIEPDGRAHT